MKFFAIVLLSLAPTLIWAQYDRQGEMPSYAREWPTPRNACDLRHRSETDFLRASLNERVRLSNYDATRIVDSLYRGLLGRDAEEPSRANWIRTFTNLRGEEVGNLLNKIYNFAETRSPNGSPSEFNTRLRDIGAEEMLASIDRHFDFLSQAYPRQNKYLWEQGLCMLETGRVDLFMTKAVLLLTGKKGLHDYDN